MFGYLADVHISPATATGIPLGVFALLALVWLTPV
jgi:hypothetical protein